MTGVVIGDTSSDMDAPYLATVKESGTFLSQFIGKNSKIAEGDIDMVTGATTSSKGVLDAVNSLLPEAPAAEAHAEEAAPAEPEGTRVEASGLTGTFEVTVAQDENGAVTGVVIGDTSSDMDAPYLATVKESDTFLGQFIGKNSKIAESDIDMVTGATTSSKGVLDAVNSLLPEAPAAEAPAEEAAPAEPEGTRVEAGGLTGTFEVTVAQDESGAVTGVVIGDTSSDMDAPYLATVKESDTFLSQFIGKTSKIAEGDIDMVTGATTSSKGVLDAVNSLLPEAPAAEAPAEEAAPAEPEGTRVEASGQTGRLAGRVAE